LPDIIINILVDGIVFGAMKRVPFLAALARAAPALARRRMAQVSAGGTFEVTTADTVEGNEAHIHTLPRLRFRFDRKHLGRLRQLIDLMNREIE